MKNKIEKPVFRLCNDSNFKEIFSKVPNALIMLVSDILDIDYDSIKDNTKVELASELNKTREKNKTTICDFIVKIGDHFNVNVEMNKNYYNGLLERNLLFTSRLLSNTIPKGTKYSNLPKYKVGQLNINCFSNANGKIIAKMMLVDADTGMIQTESMFFYNFDIVKCYNLYYNNDEKDRNNRIIRWGTLLYTSEISAISKIMGDDLLMKEDKEKFIKVAEELEEKHRLFTDDDILQLTEYKFDEARLSGFDEGAKIGTENGIKIGTENGIKYTVINMLKENYDIKEISKITGLSEEEIVKIKETL